MKVDPNQPVDYQAECLLFDMGEVVLHDDSRTPRALLEDEESAFQQYCRSLDPNKCFLMAIIPHDADRDVFFEAREVAARLGLHMQAMVDTPESHRSRWQVYKKSKEFDS